MRIKRTRLNVGDARRAVPEGTPAAPNNARTEVEAMSFALLPMARAWMKAGLGAGELATCAKLACVLIAAETAPLAGRVNQSQIAAVTGLTRKEVRAFLALNVHGGAAGPSGATQTRLTEKARTARVLHGWQTDSEFLDRRNRPRRLPLVGAVRSFQSLVKRYGGDVPPVSVLTALSWSGAVARGTGPHGTFVALKRTTSRADGYTATAMVEFGNRLHRAGSRLVRDIESGRNTGKTDR